MKIAHIRATGNVGSSIVFDKSRTAPVISRPANAPGDIPPALKELIRRRAYELFEARGGQPGHDFDDWLQAEREIDQQQGIPLRAARS